MQNSLTKYQEINNQLNEQDIVTSRAYPKNVRLGQRSKNQWNSLYRWTEKKKHNIISKDREKASDDVHRLYTEISAT